MATANPGVRGSADRLQFLDAVRGFALLLMIANHTGGSSMVVRRSPMPSANAARPCRT